MSIIALIAALALYAYSIYQLVRDDFGWWRERVRRAEGVPVDAVELHGEVRLFEHWPRTAESLEPPPDEPGRVDVRAAMVPALQLVGLIHGEGALELLPGPRVVVKASPAALRRLLLLVLHQVATGQRRSDSLRPAPVCVHSVAVLAVYSARPADQRAARRRVDRCTRRAADALGWSVARDVESGTVRLELGGYRVEGRAETLWS